MARRGAWLVEDLKRVLPKPPLPPRKQHHAVAGLGQVGDQRLAVLLEHLRARRQLQHHVGAAGAGAVLAHAMAALLRLEVLLVAIVEQRVEVRHAFEDDVAAFAAVAAVRSAELDIFLAAEADAAVAAVTGAHIDLGFIEELHFRALSRGLRVASSLGERPRRASLGLARVTGG